MFILFRLLILFSICFIFCLFVSYFLVFKVGEWLYIANVILLKLFPTLNKVNVLFLTSDNEFSRIMYSLFGGRQNIFLIVFSSKCVVKCAAKILKDFMPKTNFE